MTAPAYHDLTGRTALVTGASRGIGRAIALGLAGAGMAVAAVARDRDRLDAVAAEIMAAGGECLSVAADVAEVAAVESWVGDVWEWRGGVRTLVNVAGTTNRSGPLDVTPEEWDRVFAVNVTGLFFVTQAVGRRMLAGDGGTVVNVASLSAVVSDGAQAAYSASKAAVVQMTSVLADQWAPTVRLNTLSPGWVRTDMTAAYLAREENVANVQAATPLGRVADPEEMVGAVLFLASGMSSYMTGQNVLVDGGWTC